MLQLKDMKKLKKIYKKKGNNKDDRRRQNREQKNIRENKQKPKYLDRMKLSL